MTRGIRFLQNSVDNLPEQFTELIHWADEVILCVSYATRHAFSLLYDEFEIFLRNGGRLRAIFDIERMVTDSTIIEEIATIPGDAQCKVFFREKGNKADPGSLQGIFHPKLYVFKKGNDIKVILGSSNFTSAGLTKNIEANILIEGNVKDELCSELLHYFQNLWDSPDVIIPTESLLQDYSRAVSKSRTQREKFEGMLDDARKEVEQAAEEAHIEMKSPLNTETAYLLGLLCGSGRMPDFQKRTVTIRYHKGAFNAGTKNEGIIMATDISKLRLSQTAELKRDVEGIKEKLESLFSKREPENEVKITKKSDYDYHITISFSEKSSYWLYIHEFLKSCKIKRNRFIPVIPSEILTTNKKHIPLSFLRGYVDIRSRISVADREGPAGPLRIAISVSLGATKFGKQIEKILRKHLGVKRVSILSGKQRGRETMLRCDPTDLPKDFFLSPWQRLLLNDFSQYNRKNYPKRYK